jgi:hypothetical protein
VKLHEANGTSDFLSAFGVTEPPMNIWIYPCVSVHINGLSDPLTEEGAQNHWTEAERQEMIEAEIAAGEME